MYRGVKGLSGISACRWYIDEDLPEINAFRASLPEGPITAHIPGEQPMVAPAVREPPVELSVQELLDLDPFDNMKKQFLVKVVITRLGYDNRWWFLSCRKCHKTAHVSGRQYRYIDLTCSSNIADPSYCVCTFGSDGAAEAEFMFFDKASRSVTGKPLMTLIQHQYPGFTDVRDLARIGGADVSMPVEIARIVTQKYRLVLAISSKSLQPTSTQLSFQVNRIDQTFKPELAPLGFGDTPCTPGASSSAGSSGELVPVLTPFPMVPPSALAVTAVEEQITMPKVLGGSFFLCHLRLQPLNYLTLLPKWLPRLKRVLLLEMLFKLQPWQMLVRKLKLQLLKIQRTSLLTRLKQRGQTLLARGVALKRKQGSRSSMDQARFVHTGIFYVLLAYQAKSTTKMSVLLKRASRCYCIAPTIWPSSLKIVTPASF